MLILLDRDGTLIEEKDYLTNPKEVKLLPGAVQGLKRLKRAGFHVVVTTNQSGVGRGIVTLKQMHRVNARFMSLLRRHKAPVDGLYFCPHSPSDNCSCRKPKLGMVKCAAQALGLSWRKSISVGDRPSDIELGQKTGGQGILVLTGYGKKWKNGPAKPDHIAKNFLKAVDWILDQKEPS